MSSISLPNPLQLVTANRQKELLGQRTGAGRAIREKAVREVAFSAAGRDGSAPGALSPGLFWKIVGALALALCVYNAVGTAWFGSDWLFAYWNAWDYWSAGGYYR